LFVCSTIDIDFSLGLMRRKNKEKYSAMNVCQANIKVIGKNQYTTEQSNVGRLDESDRGSAIRHKSRWMLRCLCFFTAAR